VIACLSYCDVAREQGGEILLGGNPPADPAFAARCYLMPTVVRAKPADRVCQEEVFGPFVAVTTFKDEAEVIAIANGTPYGLGGGLWTSNLQRAHRVARAMISGMVWVNCYKARKSRLTVRRRARFRLRPRDGLTKR